MMPFWFGTALVTSAAAQTTVSTSISAAAGVVSVALTATGVADLDFGAVLAGAVSSPADLATDAGRFDLTGEPSAAIGISFTLPAVLTGPGGSIPIDFGVSDGLLWAPYPTAFTTFDPNVPFSTALDASGNLAVGISGTVSPPLGTTPGTYTGTIGLLVAYF
jgi:hypothetical protein